MGQVGTPWYYPALCSPRSLRAGTGLCSQVVLPALGAAPSAPGAKLLSLGSMGHTIRLRDQGLLQEVCGSEMGSAYRCSQHLCFPEPPAPWLCHSSHPRAPGHRDVTATCTWTLELLAPAKPPDASPAAVGTRLKRWWWQCLRTWDCLHMVLPGAGVLFFLQALWHR